jgi:nucleotide-binding universal stress UspA family protein
MSDLHVLLPLDGSPAADQVVGPVSGLAPATVTMLHAAGGSPVGGAYFDGAERRLREAGVKDVRRLTQGGEAAKVILDLAPGSGAGLIALSTHGQSGWDLLRLGTVAERVIRAAKIPVLAVPEQAKSGGLLTRILAAQDGSELAEAALTKLADLFPSMKGPVELQGVVEAYAGPVRLGGTDVASRYYQLQADDLRERLEAVSARLAARGIASQVSVDLGRPAAKILDRAQERAATLIVMATHGRSGLSRWTLGSVVEQVLRASTIPVLVAR